MSRFGYTYPELATIASASNPQVNLLRIVTNLYGGGTIRNLSRIAERLRLRNNLFPEVLRPVVQGPLNLASSMPNVNAALTEDMLKGPAQIALSGKSRLLSTLVLTSEHTSPPLCFGLCTQMLIWLSFMDGNVALTPALAVQSFIAKPQALPELENKQTVLAGKSRLLQLSKASPDGDVTGIKSGNVVSAAKELSLTCLFSFISSSSRR